LKKLLTTILCIYILAVSGCGPRVAIKKDYDFSKIKRIAVTPFTSSNAYFSTNDIAGDAVADEFIIQFMQKSIDIVERFKLDAVMKEFSLASSGMLDSETVKKIGKLVGADAILAGTVFQYLPNRRDIIYVDDGTGSKRQEIFMVDAEIGLSVRLIDVETGVIVWAGNYRYNSFYIESAIRGAVTGLIHSLDKYLPKT